MELHSPTAQHYTFYFYCFQLLILTIQIFFTQHISFWVMCRERAWLVKVHITPLTKFRPETPYGVKTLYAKYFQNRNCGFPII